MLLRTINIFLLIHSPFPDQNEYLAIADGFLQGHYDTTFRTPGYPAFIAMVFALFGKHTLAVKITQMILDIVTLILIYKISHRLFDTRTTGIAVLILSMYPYSIYYTAMISTETLFTFWIILSIYLMIRFYDIRNFQRLFLFSLAISCGIYTRPSFILFALLGACWIIIIHESDRIRGFIRSAIFLLLIFLCMLPQFLLNYSHTGHFLFTTWGGVNFYIGNNPQATGSFYGKPLEELIKDNKLMELNEVERYNFYLTKGFEFIKENPLSWLILLLKKFYLFWNPLPSVPWIYKLISILSYGVILPFSIYGMVKSKIDGKLLLLFILMFSSICIASLICFSLIRLRNPIDPLLIVFASHGFCMTFVKNRE
ncbi:glycosyltransferase family 39 protein [bacterium]|nr:glycosyltransferase family 39 protein [bacterium]